MRMRTGPYGDNDLVPNQNWSVLAHLALGVTTVFDPSSQASTVFAAQEMQRAGLILGPRIFSTGEIVYGARGRGNFNDIQSYDDALAHVHRLKMQGAAGVKNYNQPRRDQRQQVVAASIAENIQVVAEGASLFAQDIALIADGNTALEHNIPQLDLYEDVISFFAQTKVAYTPTLVVTYGGLAGDPYWRSHMDVWRHPILSKHVPPHILQPANVRRTQAPDEDFVDGRSASQALKLFKRGRQRLHWRTWPGRRTGGALGAVVVRARRLHAAGGAEGRHHPAGEGSWAWRGDIGVEAEVDDVAVLHDVFLAFVARLAGFLGADFAACRRCSRHRRWSGRG
jgi:hypothetical protein